MHGCCVSSISSILACVLHMIRIPATTNPSKCLCLRTRRQTTGTNVQGNRVLLWAAESPPATPIPVVVVTMGATTAPVPIGCKPGIRRLASVLCIVRTVTIADLHERPGLCERRTTPQADRCWHRADLRALKGAFAAPLPIAVVPMGVTVLIVPISGQSFVCRRCRRQR